MPPAASMLRPSEVAIALGVSRDSVIRRLKDGGLRGVRLGRLWLIPRDAIDSLANATPAPAPPADENQRALVSEVAKTIRDSEALVAIGVDDVQLAAIVATLAPLASRLDLVEAQLAAPLRDRLRALHAQLVGG